MWKPHYTINDRILQSTRQIGEVLGEVRASSFPRGTLAQLEHRARELSIFASTSIEGNPLSLTDVKKLLKHAPKRLRDTEREILNYNRALSYVYEKVRKKKFILSLAEFERIQSIVVDGLMDNPVDIGKLRARPVVIRDPRKLDVVVFIPPDVKDLRKLCQQLCDFVNQSLGKIDPILLAGLFHRQSVIIHPFMDGNGRTTRIVTTALLGMSGIDLFEIFSFENYYNQNVSRYFKHVGLQGDYYDHKAPDFTGWLEYFVDGILDELKRVQKSIPSFAAESQLLEHYHQVLEFIRVHGSITQRQYGEISDRSLASRKLDFAKMVELRLITSEKAGRNTRYVAREIV